MQKWEYLRASIRHLNGIAEVYINAVEIFNRYGKNEGQKFNLPDYLAKLGEDGWELVSSSAIESTEFLYFKRPLG